jgi:FixJ family two-component response regulator
LLHLLYLDAIDLRVSLLVSSAGFDMWPVSKVDAFLAHRGRRAGVVLVDAGHAHEQALSLVRELVLRSKSANVVVICNNGSIDFFRQCFHAGAIDVLDKSFDDWRIGEALKNAAAAEFPSPLGELRHVREGRFARLTQREKEVFGCLLAGHTNRAMGKILGVSPRTVEVHRSRLGEKLAVRNVAQLASEYGFLYRDLGCEADPSMRSRTAA